MSDQKEKCEIKHIESEAQFNEIISGKKPVLVDFSAEWCGPCKMMVPILEDMAENYKSSDKIEIVKVDVDQLRELAMKFGIMSMPTFIYFKDGEPVKFDGQSLIIGMRSQDELIEKFDTLI